jgi:hypothetical protein
MATSMNTEVFWDVALCSLIQVGRSIRHNAFIIRVTLYDALFQKSVTFFKMCSTVFYDILPQIIFITQVSFSMEFHQ